MSAAAVTHSSWRIWRYFETLGNRLLQFASKFILLSLSHNHTVSDSDKPAVQYRKRNPLVRRQHPEIKSKSSPSAFSFSHSVSVFSGVLLWCAKAEQGKGGNQGWGEKLKEEKKYINTDSGWGKRKRTLRDLSNMSERNWEKEMKGCGESDSARNVHRKFNSHWSKIDAESTSLLGCFLLCRIFTFAVRLSL